MKEGDCLFLLAQRNADNSLEGIHGDILLKERLRQIGASTCKSSKSIQRLEVNAFAAGIAQLCQAVIFLCRLEGGLGGRDILGRSLQLKNCYSHLLGNHQLDLFMLLLDFL